LYSCLASTIKRIGKEQDGDQKAKTLIPVYGGEPRREVKNKYRAVGFSETCSLRLVLIIFRLKKMLVLIFKIVQHFPDSL